MLQGATPKVVFFLVQVCFILNHLSKQTKGNNGRRISECTRVWESNEGISIHRISALSQVFSLGQAGPRFILGNIWFLSTASSDPWEGAGTEPWSQQGVAQTPRKWRENSHEQRAVTFMVYVLLLWFMFSIFGPNSELVRVYFSIWRVGTINSTQETVKAENQPSSHRVLFLSPHIFYLRNLTRLGPEQ